MTTATPVETSVLIDSMWQARSAEHDLCGRLASTQSHVPEGAYHQLLTDEAEHARQRLHDLDARLTALGQQPGPLAAGMTTVRHLADDTLGISMALVTGGLRLLRRDPIEPPSSTPLRSRPPRPRSPAPLIRPWPKPPAAAETAPAPSWRRTATPRQASYSTGSTRCSPR